MKSQAEMDAEEWETGVREGAAMQQYEYWDGAHRGFINGVRKFLEFAEANAFPVRGYVHKAVTLDVLRSYLEGIGMSRDEPIKAAYEDVIAKVAKAEGSQFVYMDKGYALDVAKKLGIQELQDYVEKFNGPFILTPESFKADDDTT